MSNLEEFQDCGSAIGEPRVFIPIRSAEKIRDGENFVSIEAEKNKDENNRINE